MRQAWRLPIRFRISALITLSIGVSLVSVLVIATTLMREDKVSYVFDLNMAQARSVAEGLEQRLARIHDAGRIFAKFGEDPTLGKVFRDQRQEIDAQALILLRPSEDRSVFKIVSVVTAAAKNPQAAREAQEAKDAFAQLAWTPAQLNQEGTLTGPSFDGAIPFAGTTTSKDGKPMAYFFLTRAMDRIPEGIGAARIAVFDRHGISVAHAPSKLMAGALEDLGKELSGVSFPAGVREWRNTGLDYVVSYQRIINGYVVVSITSKEKAFEAIRVLRNRAMILGLSVFLVALGGTLIFSRTLTGQLHKMWNTTQRISQGDFGSRIDLKGKVSDEVTDLASAFNLMAAKINELMRKEAEKARLESELKTAQVVQSYLFPSEGIVRKDYRVMGKFLPATECGGDWWSCAEVGGKLVLVVGDVTGHGASAALLTAVAHGAFHTHLDELNANDPSRLSIDTLVERVNDAVSSAGNNHATMTFFAALFDPKTGELSYCNAAHCIPFIYRESIAPHDPNPTKRFISLLVPPGPPVGARRGVKHTKRSIQLKASDVVVLYTDGLIECENNEAEQLGKRNLLRMVDDVIRQDALGRGLVADRLMERYLKFLNTAADQRADDITVVALAVEPDARFTGMREEISPGIALAAR